MESGIFFSVKSLVIIYIVFSICGGCSNGVMAASMCNQSSVFNKASGYRPSVATPVLLYNSSTPGSGITLQCFNSCNNVSCTAFYIDYDASACYALQEADLNVTKPQFIKGDYNFFQRMCVAVVPPQCNNSLWTTEVAVGYRLQGYDTNMTSNVTANECGELCVNSTSCRSAAFYNTTLSGTGNCFLSREDRRTQPESYVPVPGNVIYIENQCVQPSNGSCSLNEYTNSTLASFNDVTIMNTTISQCEQSCLAEQSFICRGFSYLSGTNTTNSTCSLHSDDSFDLGPSAIIVSPSSTYRERVKCLNLTVSCDSFNLNITLFTSAPFNGAVYAQGGNNSACSVYGNGTTMTSLELPLTSSPGMPSCGSLVTTLDNSTGVTQVSRIASALIVVQQNSIIQTIGDRILRVTCNVATQSPPDKTLNSTIEVGTGNGNTGVSNVTAVINSSIPSVILKVIDVNNGTVNVNQTTLGQPLQFRINVEQTNAPFGILVYNLTATDPTQANSLILLDTTGCPTNPTIFPALSQDASGNYYSNFNAFRFADSALVMFTLNVHFCAVACQAIVCTNGVLPGGSRLRREHTDLSTSSAVVDAVMQRLHDDEARDKDLVYQLELTVKDKARVQRTIQGEATSMEDNSSTYIIGEGGDFGNISKPVQEESDDYVCMLYTSFLGLLIGWIFLQVLLILTGVCFVKWQMEKQDKQLEKKLHQDLLTFDENRQVHWSENVEAFRQSRVLTD